MLFPAAQVHVQPVEAESVRLGAVPVHIGVQRVLSLPRGIPQSRVALLDQPGIQVDLPVERRETVIRHDDERRLVVDHLEGAAHDLGAFEFAP